jgi:hypothetical protein
MTLNYLDPFKIICVLHSQASATYVWDAVSIAQVYVEQLWGNIFPADTRYKYLYNI